MLSRREMLARLAGWNALLLLEGCAAAGRPALEPRPTVSAGRAGGTIYFVHPEGDSDNRGTSPHYPWPSLERVAAAGLQPGDTVLLAAGVNHPGGVWFDPTSLRSTTDQPVRFGRYGAGRSPTILGGIAFDNVGGVRIEQLEFAAAGGEGLRHGVQFHTNVPGRLPSIGLFAVRVHGFRDGFRIGSWAGDAGFDGIRIEHCTSFDNDGNGVVIYAEHRHEPGEYHTPHRSLVLRAVRCFRNRGVPGENSGFGIIASGVAGGVIEDCEAWGNGARGGRGDGGPFGIMVWASRGVTVRCCYAHHNESATVDGGGIDLDGDCIDCTIEHCYTHDNMAAGYFLAGFRGSGEFSGNTLRYSISENDGRLNTPRAGVSVWRRSPLGTFRNNRIYGNTVYFGQAGDRLGAALELRSPTTELSIHNNIFITANGARLLQGAGGQVDLRLDGNAYHAVDRRHLYRFDGAEYETLASFRAATGLEAAGIEEAPLLLAPGEGGAAPGGELQAVHAYRLRPGSPMTEAGLDLRDLGFELPAHDFYGYAIPAIGAVRAIGAATRAEAGLPPARPQPTEARGRS